MALSQAYEARNEAQAKITALKDKNEKEVAQYNIELKELTRVLEHDRKLKTFMGIKSQDRAKASKLKGLNTQLCHIRMSNRSLSEQAVSAPPAKWQCPLTAFVALI